MLNLKDSFTTLQNHIKKSKSHLTTFMYNTDGIMFILMTPFVMLHEKHFDKVEYYVKTLNEYSKANNLGINLETFRELENSAILYSKDQMGALTSKQYEAKLKYLDYLNDKVEFFKKAN